LASGNTVREAMLLLTNERHRNKAGYFSDANLSHADYMEIRRLRLILTARRHEALAHIGAAFIDELMRIHRT